jgi:hypothetical protein
MHTDIYEKVDSLEAILGEFIVQTRTICNRMDREMKEFKEEMKEFKEEMKANRINSEKEIQAQKEKTDKDIQAIREKTDKDIQAMREKTDKDIQAEIKKINLKIQAQKEQQEKDIQAQKEQQEKDIQAQKKQQEKDIQARKEQQEKDIQAQKEQQEKDIQDSNEKLEKKIQADKEKSEREIIEFKKEIRKDARRMNKQWGDLANKMGTIVEDIISPAVRPVVKKYFKCKVHSIAINYYRNDELLGISGEFDVIAASNEFVFLVEAKSTPKTDYIDKFIINIEKFRMLFPEYKDKKLIPIFASLRLEKEIVEYATKLQIYMMAYREWDYMDILNFNKLNIPTEI